jgi:hypothetical protein
MKRSAPVLVAVSHAASGSGGTDVPPAGSTLRSPSNAVSPGRASLTMESMRSTSRACFGCTVRSASRFCVISRRKLPSASTAIPCSRRRSCHAVTVKPSSTLNTMSALSMSSAGTRRVVVVTAVTG